MAQIIEPTQPGDSSAALPPLSPEELAPHFPQLEILECLGRGGMGVVYKARQKSLNRLVALKLLAPERANDPQFAARFEKEAHALAALNHPNIVSVYDFGLARGFYFLLMEFVDGMNLRQLLQARRLTPKEALGIVPPVCEALQCAHDHGIVHCDIKPENLLIDKAGAVKIADFGIAKIIGSERGDYFPGESAQYVASSSLPFGTPDYAAPEQANGTADHRADIYSLGVVLYEMLTGERPKEKIEAPSKRVQVDVRIDEIVLRALAKTPELRFATAAEFRTQVEAVSSGVPQEKAPTPPSGLLKSERGRITWDAAAGIPMRPPAVGDVVLHGDRLVLSSGAERSEIPLKNIRALHEAVPPAWWAPAGPSFAAIEFEEDRQRRWAAFIPGTAPFRTVGDTQHHVAEWLTALQGAIQTATGHPMPVSSGRRPLAFAASPAAFIWLVPFIVLGIWVLTILTTRREGSGFPVGLFLPLMILAGILSARFWSRGTRPLSPGVTNDSP